MKLSAKPLLIVPDQPPKNAAMRLKLATARTEFAHGRRADQSLRRFSEDKP